MASQETDKGFLKKSSLTWPRLPDTAGRPSKKAISLSILRLICTAPSNGRQITDKEIARDLGITPSTLSKYKNGEIELGQISLLAALLEKIPADQRMLPFQWAEAYQETILTPISRR